MSNINGASGSHYISNAAFLEWMQTKTDGLYAKMSDAMDISNDRADAEDALNTIKAKIADVQAGKGDPNELYALIDKTIKTYSDEFPKVKETLSPIAQEMQGLGARLPDGTDTGPAPWIPAPPPKTIPAGPRLDEKPNPAYKAWADEFGAAAAKNPELVKRPPPPKVTIDLDTAKRWQEGIKNRVEDFAKQDQLGLINLQEFNSQLNQAKQMASTLLDSADKAANTIISRIS